MPQHNLMLAFLTRNFLNFLTPGFKEITTSVFGFVADNMQTDRHRMCPIVSLPFKCSVLF